ncbi:MAG TPA: triose-phosphate isomerase [Spirochaetota bacterium]|nr:triose-phosphate isomerase [Spirochaetota bacterium]HOL57592.1 triose-phosphate isomerase [Spirochaetota bacterium]HPP04524.1 triose-phosphate isomerase [Spirochaetota bacterium]
MRKYLIAGNWKMNLTPSEAKKYTKQLVDSIKNVPDDVMVMITPSFVSLPLVAEVLKGSIIKLGAQNVNDNEKGAFTGEVSADMLLDIGVEYVIIGHSERRHIYKESNELINKKILFALKKGLKPVFCIGELIEEREAGKTNEVLKTQIVEGLKNVSKEDMKNVIIAYEPVWAIGTGKVATPEIAEDAHKFCRNLIKDLYDNSVSENIIIQYGGSVIDTNVDGLMKQPDIDGALVGGASLKLESFTRIVNFQR